MRPHIIGIAGPSCSGKTEITRQLTEKLDGVAVVSLDSYYRTFASMPFEERVRQNFDDPASIEWELLREHLGELAAGRGFDEPVYSFAEYARTSLTKRVEPGKFVIVEGLFVLYWPELRSLLDTKIYVETEAAVCFARRLARDVAERGRSPESVRDQYERTVRPSAEWFVHPTRPYADLVVSGEEPLANSTAAVLRFLGRGGELRMSAAR